MTRIVGTKLTQKGISSLKKRKLSSNSTYSISLGSKFQSQQTILISWNKFPKKDTSG